MPRPARSPPTSAPASQREGLEKAAAALGLVRKESDALVPRGQPLGDLGASVAVETAVYSLPVGGLSEPVRTPAGWAVVRVLEKKEFDPAAFEKEKAALTASLTEERRGKLFGAYMQEARKRFPVLRRPDALRRVTQLMHVEVRRAGDVVIVDLKGKLTAGLGDQILRDTLDELLAESWRKILLNLSEVSFLDSAGLGELVAGLKTARNLGAELKVVKASERVRNTLSLARLLPLFEVFEDEQEALRRFGGS